MNLEKLEIISIVKEEVFLGKVADAFKMPTCTQMSHEYRNDLLISKLFIQATTRQDKGYAICKFNNVCYLFMKLGRVHTITFTVTDISEHNGDVVLDITEPIETSDVLRNFIEDKVADYLSVALCTRQDLSFTATKCMQYIDAVLKPNYETIVSPLLLSVKRVAENLNNAPVFGTSKDMAERYGIPYHKSMSGGYDLVMVNILLTFYRAISYRVPKETMLSLVAELTRILRDLAFIDTADLSDLSACSTTVFTTSVKEGLIAFKCWCLKYAYMCETRQFCVLNGIDSVSQYKRYEHSKIDGDLASPIESQSALCIKILESVGIEAYAHDCIGVEDEFPQPTLHLISLPMKENTDFITGAISDDAIKHSSDLQSKGIIDLDFNKVLEQILTSGRKKGDIKILLTNPRTEKVEDKVEEDVIELPIEDVRIDYKDILIKYSSCMKVGRLLLCCREDGEAELLAPVSETTYVVIKNKEIKK